MGYRLLAITQDLALLRQLQAIAEQNRYALVGAPNGSQGMGLVQLGAPDLVLVEARLPDMEGLAWLKMFRQTEAGRGLPVLVLSETHADRDMAEAFQWGADDYILKSCDAAELSARVKAVLRRRFERDEIAGAAMSFGPVALDPARHECRVRGKRVDLRPREFELLEILMRKAGRVLSRVYLLETIWGMSRSANTRAVDVGVSRLRSALGTRAGRWIETVERFGYRFREPSW